MVSQKQELEQNNSSGFSLLEVMMALAIFSIGILALANLQMNSTNHNSRARKHTDAVTVAQNQIERLMAVPFSGPYPATANLTGGAAIDTPSAVRTNTIDSYTAQWTVIDRDLDGNGTTDFKEITLFVSDPAGRGRFTTAFSRAIAFN